MYFSRAGDRGLDAVGAPLYAFLVGYPAGGVAILVFGLAQWARHRLPFAGLIWAAAVYVLPLVSMNNLETRPHATERTLFFDIRERRDDGGHVPPLKEFRIRLERNP